MIYDGIDFDKMIEPMIVGEENALISNLCDTCFTNYDFYNLLLGVEGKTENLEQLFFDIEKPILSRLLELKEN